MLYPAPNPVKQTTDWNFLELWVDGIVFPPRILMLVSETNGQFSIYDPNRNYRPIFIVIPIKNETFETFCLA